MTLGIDFDGTSVKYLICAKSGACDGRIVAQAESLEAANRELKFFVNRTKTSKASKNVKCWIVKRTVKYERIYETEIDNSEQ